MLIKRLFENNKNPATGTEELTNGEEKKLSRSCKRRRLVLPNYRDLASSSPLEMINLFHIHFS